MYNYCYKEEQFKNIHVYLCAVRIFKYFMVQSKNQLPEPATEYNN